MWNLNFFHIRFLFRLKCLPMSSDILPSNRLAVVPPFMLNICTFHWRDHRYHIEPHCNDISPAFQSWHVPAWESPDHWTSERMGVGGWLWGPNNWAPQTQLNVLTFFRHDTVCEISRLTLLDKRQSLIWNITYCKICDIYYFSQKCMIWYKGISAF